MSVAGNFLVSGEIIYILCPGSSSFEEFPKRNPGKNINSFAEILITEDYCFEKTLISLDRANYINYSYIQKSGCYATLKWNEEVLCMLMYSDNQDICWNETSK